MKRLLMCLSGICFLLFWLECADSESPAGPAETIIVKEYSRIDTVSSDTASHTTDMIKDSIVSDTVVTIEPLTDTVDYIVVTTKTIFDTIYKIPVVVESTFVEHYISSKTIIDSFFTLLDTIHSDTILIELDTLYEIFIETISPDTVDVDTVLYSTTTLSDTHFVTTYVVATTSDYMTGNAGIAVLDWISTDTLIAVSSGLLPIHADNSIYTYNGSIYILESFGADNIIRIGGTVISQSNVVYQINIGTAVNLHDMSFVNETKVYITQYSNDTVVIFDPENGIKTGGIDLGQYSMFAGTDSAEVPFMQCSKIIGDKVYVLCQRLETVQTPWGPTPMPTGLTGLIVIISTVTDSVVKTIPLIKKNPASMDVVDGYLYVSSTGSWEDPADGGIERIDLTTDSCLGVIIEESSFGSNISNIVMVSATKGYVRVSMNNEDWTEFWTDLVEFDPSTGTVGFRIYFIEDAFGGEVYDGRYLYVGDRSTTKPGIVVIDPTDNSKVAGPLRLGPEPPNSIAVFNVSQ